MDLAGIEARAKKEGQDISEYLTLIGNKIREYPNGTDIHISERVIPSVEEYCDLYDIPFYHVTENCCSVAKTYAKLFAHEQRR